MAFALDIFIYTFVCFLHEVSAVYLQSSLGVVVASPLERVLLVNMPFFWNLIGIRTRTRLCWSI